MDKKNEQGKNEKVEISMEDAEKVSGAGNPFENVPRVENKDYDSTVKDKMGKVKRAL